MWTIIFSKKAQKLFNRLDPQTKKQIAHFIDDKLIVSENPRQLGKLLVGKSLGHHIRYRVGDYRLICNINDQEINILILHLGHRKEVYRDG